MKLPLVQGAYQARGVIANAQSCINMYPEPNTQDAPFPMSHYPSPGLSVFIDYTGTYSGYVRGMYDTSNGALVWVIGNNVISWNGGSYLLGTIGTSSGPVSMCDNQTDLVITDGSSNGYYCPLSSILTPGSLQQIDDPAFYGSNRVDFIDTFLIFNWPGTPTWYSTISNALLPFDAQYFAGKEGWNDYTVCVAALHDNVWVLGNNTVEIWFNAGGSLFPFARMPNSVLQQGCVSWSSVVVADNAIYWLSQDRWGRNMLIRGEGYAARRVSTFAVEDEWSTYSTLTDCVGMVYQLGGHETIGLWFPTANTWWAYDAATQQFHKRTYNGINNAWLPSCMCGWGSIEGLGYPNSIVAGDRTGPRIFVLSRNNYTDAGTTITRQRSWMHVTNEGHRQLYTRFQANFSGPGLTDGQGTYPDGVTLAWSDDGGNSFNPGIEQTGGNANNASYLWRRLGYARDRVFQISLTAQGEFTLNGAWIDVIPEAT